MCPLSKAYYDDMNENFDLMLPTKLTLETLIEVSSSIKFYYCYYYYYYYYCYYHYYYCYYHYYYYYYHCYYCCCCCYAS